ncbi:unnamed protein product [marine sediment metagenome]|uniref:Uncharacterized protein n=1 Tax=marine sediment metagenome TaxID=412755 RepID=X1CTZ2_9ZZZZ
MNNLTENELVGKKYLTYSDSPPIEGYFNCLKLIKPLLENLDSNSSTPVFYINVAGNLNVVRLTYFTNDAEETKKE